MPEIPNVIPDEPVASEWGNDIRDRVTQRFATKAARAASIPTPEAGAVSYLADTGDVEVYHGSVWRRLGVPPGTVAMLAGGAAPTGWLLCNGSAVSRSTYADLFTQIGTVWGAGDGSTTFNVPDMRGRFPRGVAASGTGNVIGNLIGADTHTHGLNSHTHTGPSHTHTISGSTSTGGAHDHDGTFGAIKTSAVGGHTFVGTGADPQMHNHAIETQGAHGHTFSDTSTASGTGATGPSTGSSAGASTGIPAAAAINFMIRT